MPPERFPPDDPREWLRYARGDLALARTRLPDVDLSLLAFHAQQTAEKAIKAVMIQHGVQFPYIHDLAPLLDRLRHNGVHISEHVAEADRLSRYAVLARYPLEGGVPEDEYGNALQIAETVLRWAEGEVDG